jgi:hypothetical protein
MVEGHTSPSGLLSRISAFRISNSHCTASELGTRRSTCHSFGARRTCHRGIAVYYFCANRYQSYHPRQYPQYYAPSTQAGSSCKTRNHARFVKRWGHSHIIPSRLDSAKKVGRRTPIRDCPLKSDIGSLTIWVRVPWELSLYVAEQP